VRLLAGGAVVVFLLARVGTDPFVDGLRVTIGGPLLAATALTAVSTVACAWRWRRVAGALGVRIGLRTAVAAVYRAQFLNATLPGGIVGDLDRALGHARSTGATGPGVRSVVWERTLGQAVQVGLTVGVLLLAPSPLRPSPAVSAAVVVCCALALLSVVGLHRLPRLHGRPRTARVTRRVASDLGVILRSRRDRAWLIAASALAVVGHVLVFLLAARAVGVPAGPTTLVPLAAVVLAAAAVPANLAGWGPREGVAAWSFAMAGLGADAGVTTSVAFGVLALVGTLPGALLLLARRGSAQALARPPALLKEAAHG
jgi:uncharacterized membrane protein YbhN (UPF0104 family)